MSAKPKLTVEVSTVVNYQLTFDEDALIALAKAELIRRINEEHGIDLRDGNIAADVPYDPFYVHVSATVKT